MYTTKFNSIAEALKLNNLTEPAAMTLLKRFMENANYRESYNHRKNELNKLLKNDPIVLKRMTELKVKQG